MTSTVTSHPQRPAGDADVAAVASLVGEPSRAGVLMALADGRALPPSSLAIATGLSRPAISAHLTKLVAGGLLRVEQSGRHRYYRLAGPEVADLIESLARLAPATPIRSLRQSTRARALRAGRTCYDHLAGTLGVAVTAALVAHRALTTVDGRPDVERRHNDPLSGSTISVFRLGDKASEVFDRLGVDLPGLQDSAARRPLIRSCIDWSEQRHHVSGRLGAAVATALSDNGWLTRGPQRAVVVTDRGAAELHAILGVG